MSVESNGNGGSNVSFAFVAGLFFGTLVGATTAIFIAPGSGRELRETLSKGAKRFVAQVSELVPEEWSEIAQEEITKEIIENVSILRAAGL